MVSSSEIPDFSPGSSEDPYNTCSSTPHSSTQNPKKIMEQGPCSSKSFPEKHFLERRKPLNCNIPVEFISRNPAPRLRGNPRGRPRKHSTARPRGRGRGRALGRNLVSVIQESKSR